MYISSFSAITGHYLLLIKAPKGIWRIIEKLLFNKLAAGKMYGHVRVAVIDVDSIDFCVIFFYFLESIMCRNQFLESGVERLG